MEEERYVRLCVCPIIHGLNASSRCSPKWQPSDKEDGGVIGKGQGPTPKATSIVSARPHRLLALTLLPWQLRACDHDDHPFCVSSPRAPWSHLQFVRFAYQRGPERGEQTARRVQASLILFLPSHVVECEER